MMVDSITNSVKSLLRPSILFILFLPFVAASAFWLLILFFMWNSWVGFFTSTAAYDWLLRSMGEGLFLESLTFFVIMIATLFVFGPLWYLTYILIIALLLFPLLLPKVQKIYYPQLELKRGGNFSGSIKNVLMGTIVYIFGFAISLPLWFFTPFAPFVILVFTAYLNKKVFIYDIFQDYASEQERIEIEKTYSHEFWILGLITGFLSWLPLANILAPALTALIFIHYCFARLEQKRRA